MPPPPVVQSSEVPFNAQKSWDFLLKQVAFGPRNPGSTGHLKCRDYLQEEMKKQCDNVRLQPFEHTWSRTGQPLKMWNIIGEQNWKDAKIRVALFAHWDTRPTADMERDPAKAELPILGANDGASGVAVLLELMRVMKHVKSDVGIQYVLVDGEDLGPGLDEMFLGAAHYAKAFPTPRPNYGILLDMVGDKHLQIPKDPLSVRSAPKLIKELYLHAAKVGLGEVFPPFIGPEIMDDHVPLNAAGLPTIDLIDFSYEPWHTHRDTPDKCSPKSLGQVGKLMETWLKKSPPFSIAD